MTQDPLAIIRSRNYVRLLVIAAVLGVPISAVAYYFLDLVHTLGRWAYNDIPRALGFDTVPMWWPLVPMLVVGLIVGFAIHYLPGGGGNRPTQGFHAGETPKPIELPGIVLAALAGVGLGAVIGPEAPLIAIGGGLGYLAIKLAKRDADDNVTAVVAATGSFAAVSALLGSPLLGAFLLMEASGLGGIKATLALTPGLLGAGIGSLIFIGIDSLTGHGTQSLVIPSLPYFQRPDIAQFGWAIAIGLAAALLGSVLLALAKKIEKVVRRYIMPLTVAAALLVAALAIGYAAWTGHSSQDVLFSGQTDLPNLIKHGAAYSLGAVVLLVAIKSLAYSLSLASFRGGPIFPAMFIGAAGGIALSHLPGLPLVPAMAMGIGSMSAAMLRLPFTSVLLASLLVASAGLSVLPLIIVAVVVSYVSAIRLQPSPAEAQANAT